MSDIAIRVENLGKMYRIGVNAPKPQNRWQAAKQTVFSPFEYLNRMRRPPTEEETLWALRDVSFEVKRGEVVGVIGRNGAGKSTLLKILSRITEPTHGYAQIHGRVGSLLEVGTGFHPELTGRENVYLSGTILGMKKVEIDRKFEEIVDFSGVEKFIDTPVKRYSSGMNVRLGFAVAAHLDPEILLVDEVLAVGDATFQRKCFEKMGDVSQQGRTILLVSHNMTAIASLCERGILLDTGCVVLDQAVSTAISKYLTDNTSSSLNGTVSWSEGVSDPGITEFLLKSVTIRDGKGCVGEILDGRNPFDVEIVYEILEAIPYCRVGFRISTTMGIVVFATYDTDNEGIPPARSPGIYVSRCQIPEYLLAPGRYVLSCAAGITGYKTLVHVENILMFEIDEIGAIGSNLTMKREGVIRPRLDWAQKAL